MVLGSGRLSVTRHGEARNEIDLSGNRMHRDPACNGFEYNEQSMWRALIGW
jgi:hypothetical protein